jgi:hypothetical protein
LTPPDVQAEMDRYFAAERSAGAFLAAGAGAGAALAAVLLATRGPWRPAAWPLLAFSLGQALVGATLVLRSPRQLRRLSERLRDTPAVLCAEESARMRRVQRSFTFFKRAWTLLLAVGLAVASVEGYGQVLYAAGLALVLEVGTMLAFDLRAERRAQRYRAAVEAPTDA